MPTNFYMRLRVLHVEDDTHVASIVSKMLRMASPYADVTLTRCTSLQGALELLLREEYDIVLLDLGLPDSDGLTTFHQVHGSTSVPVVVLTAEESIESRAQLVAAGAQDCIYKLELTPDVLLRSIRFAVERHRSLQELRLALRELQASNQALRDLLDCCGLLP